MVRLTITRPYNSGSIVRDCDIYNVKGDIVFIFKTIKADENSVARLDESKLLSIHRFVSLYIEEIEDDEDSEHSQSEEDTS